MIRNVHVEQMREQVEQARRDLAGWERMLDLAEREVRVGLVLPDPMMPLNAPWPPPPVEEARREPYTTVLPQIDGTLPPGVDAAFAAFQADHAEHSQSPEGQRDEQKWRQT